MGARSYATFNSGDLGAHLELTNGGLVVSHSVDGDSISRMVRSTDGKTAGVWRAEFLAWGPDVEDPDSHALPDKVSIGIASGDEVLTQYVGGTVESVGWRLGLGEIRTNGSAEVSSLEPIIGGQVVSLVADLDASPQKVTFYANGEPVGVVELPADGTWYLAASVGGVTAYDLNCYLNAGQSKFAMAIADTPAGWYTDPAALDPVYVANAEFLSATDDTPASTNWLGDIPDSGAAWVTRGLNFWPWNSQGPLTRASVGQLEFNNDDGTYDALLALDARDQVVRIRALQAGEGLPDADTVVTAIVERTEPVNEGNSLKVRVAVRDAITRYARQLQRALFPPNLVAGAANLPLPISLGALRNVTCWLYDEVRRLFKLHDGPLSNISSVRDKGDALDPTLDDYSTNDDLSGIQTATLPEGKATADISSEGAVAIDPGAGDVLGGDGEFSTWSAGPGSSYTPDGWDVYNAALGSDLGGQINEGAGPWVDSAYIQSRQEGGGWYIRTAATVLEEGKTYRWTMNVVAITRPVDPTNGPQGGVGLATFEATGSELLHGAAGVLAFASAAGIYSGVYTVPAGGDRKVYLTVTRSINDYAHGATCYARVDDIRFEELTAFVQTPLVGITLEQFMTQIMARADEPDDRWSADDCAAIDTSAGALATIGWHMSPDAPVNVDVAIAAPLDSFCASAYTDELGVLRFAEMVDPDDAADEDIVLEIGVDDLLEPILPIADLAPGLTATIGVRKNWTKFELSDFVDDFDPDTGITAELRRAFVNECQVYRRTTVALAAMYQHAYGAKALISLFDDPEVGQAMIDRVCGRYTVPRFFVPNIKIAMPRTRPRLGQIIRLTYPRYGFNAGKKLQLVEERPDWTGTERSLTLKGWG